MGLKEAFGVLSVKKNGIDVIAVSTHKNSDLYLSHGTIQKQFDFSPIEFHRFCWGILLSDKGFFGLRFFVSDIIADTGVAYIITGFCEFFMDFFDAQQLFVNTLFFPFFVVFKFFVYELFNDRFHFWFMRMFPLVCGLFNNLFYDFFFVDAL